VLRISVISIALAILVNSLTLAIVRGFQQQIKDKITGFNAPLFISKAGSSHIFEAEAIDRRIPFLSELKQIPGISAIRPVAFKPILLQSARFNDTIQIASGSDSTVQRQDMLGLMLKGVDPQYDWTFIRSHLVKGRLPKKENINEVLLSLTTANMLNISLNQDFSSYHIKQKPLLKKLKVVGIYNTGFVEYDQKLVLGNLVLLQQMSDYGTKIMLRPVIEKQSLVVKIEVQGDATNLLFDWGFSLQKQYRTIRTN
jgi:lipoprotein-releasing system permease protein